MLFSSLARQEAQCTFCTWALLTTTYEEKELLIWFKKSLTKRYKTPPGFVDGDLFGSIQSGFHGIVTCSPFYDERSPAFQLPGRFRPGHRKVSNCHRYHKSYGFHRWQTPVARLPYLSGWCDRCVQSLRQLWLPPANRARGGQSREEPDPVILPATIINGCFAFHISFDGFPHAHLFAFGFESG